jgi:hypothetical protein
MAVQRVVSTPGVAVGEVFASDEKLVILLA